PGEDKHGTNREPVAYRACNAGACPVSELISEFGLGLTTHVLTAVVVGAATFVAGMVVQRVKEHRIDAIAEPIKTLGTQYECANWIEDQNKRVARKNEIFGQMRTYCKGKKIPKQQIVESNQLGRLMFLAASILERPEVADVG